MADRFFCNRIDGDSAELTDAEAHHAIHVMRLKVGDTVRLFDGAGTEAEGRVSAVSRREVRLTIESHHHTAAPASGLITVAAAPPKGDRLKWMVEKLTELGVDRFVPLQTDRSVVDPRQSRLDKLSATVIAASKQCGRCHLMTIEPATTFTQLLNVTSDQLVIAHPSSDDSEVPQANSEVNTTLLIGPEGGFTSDEVAAAVAQGSRCLAWPQTILRTETAAVALAAVVMNQRVSEAG